MAEPLRRVGRYELLEVIGRGGAAVVYLAHQPDLDRQVALKELAAHHAADPSFAQRFVEESRLAAAMNHPSIVTVFEYFESDGLPYISMEYMSQGSLRGHLQKLSGAQLGGVLERVLEGLIYAERLGIVHRDLKPENLLVGTNGEVKIADFGVARALTSSTVRPYATVAGTPIGTPAYMAPEQALAKPVTFAADLYSLGIIAWEALAGRTPFGSADTPMAVLYQQVHEPIPPIETIRDDVHPGASRWLAQMLAKRPQDRFASAQEAWEELDEVLIDMLGPRWRRDSALTGLDAAVPSVLTPTEVDPFAGAERHQPARGSAPEDDAETDDEPPRPQIAAVLTPEPAGTPRPSLDPFVPLTPLTPLTPLPEHEPVADDLHTFRAAAATATRRRRSRSRSTSRAVMVGAVVVIAAAAGGVVGATSGSSRTPTRTPVTTTSVAEHLALDVRPILAQLATQSTTALKDFNDARSQADQAVDALVVARAYGAAETRLSAMPASTRSEPTFVAFDHAVAGLDTDWRRVSYDAKHDLPKLYASEAATIAKAQKQLSVDAAAVAVSG